MAEKLLEAKNLCKYFPAGKKQTLKAVDNVSLYINKGETLGLVGESGCGKTTCGRTLTKLYAATSGTVTFDGKDVSSLKGADLLKFKKDVQMIFQDPYSSLDPRMTIAEIIGEGMDVHFKLSAAEKTQRVNTLLARVGLTEDYANRFAHELSGGQRQRVGIARALAVEPEVLLMDEPTSALDPISTSKVEELAMELKKDYTIVIVTHNMQQAARISDKTAFFLLGELVEMGPTEQVFSTPVDKRTEDYISGRFG